MAVLGRSVGPSADLVGVDFCEPMLELARRKLGDRAALILGDACALPLGARLFDLVTVGWGLRNVPDIDLALSEAARVLKPGGRFATLDMARPRPGLVGSVSEWMVHRFAPLVGRLFGRSEAYTYLPKSAERFLSREQMAGAMERAGFSDVRWFDFAFGNVCLHVGVKP